MTIEDCHDAFSYQKSQAKRVNQIRYLFHHAYPFNQKCPYNNSITFRINCPMNQEDKGGQATQSNIAIDGRMPADAGNEHYRTQKQLQFVKVVAAVLFFAIFVMLFKLAYDVRAVAKKASVSKQAEPMQAQNKARSDIAALKARLEALEASLRVPSLEDSANASSGLNESSLAEYVRQGFSRFQTTADFLHMHSSESYFYQRVEKYLRYLNTDFLRQNDKAKTAFMLAANNYRLPHTNAPLRGAVDAWLWKDYERLSREYDFSLPELPFCIVVPTINNAKNFRYEYNLQSMVNLDYKNFKIVIVDDASTDHTYELIKLWIKQNGITHDIVVLTNEKRMTAVPNIHRAVTQHCSADSIIVLVDGDDELLGRHSLKVFNDIYHKQKADVVYSNHVSLMQNNIHAYLGWSRSYSDEQKRNNRYRDVYQKIAHLRSFKTKLYLKIKEADLKDDQGQWLTSTYDEVICLPILEMSCGRVVYIQEFFYLYNVAIGSNDIQVDQTLQKNIADYIRYKKPKYECLKD